MIGGWLGLGILIGGCGFTVYAIGYILNFFMELPEENEGKYQSESENING